MVPPVKRLPTISIVAVSAAFFLAACGGGTTGAKVASVADAKGASTTTAAPSVAEMSDQTIVVGGGSAQTDGDGQDSATFKTRLLAFAKCMRDNGADFPDPQFDADGRPQFSGDRSQFDKLRNDPNFQKADKACADKRPMSGGNFNMSAEEQANMKENLLKFAACMRKAGIDFPDPTFGSDGRPEFGANGPQGDMNRDDSTFQKAETKCRTEVGMNFGPNGGGPGGPGQTTTTTAKS